MGNSENRQNDKMRIALSEEKAAQRLNKAQLAAIIEAAAQAGVHRIRFVGNDPVRYGGFATLLKQIGKIDGIWEVTLTTDGRGLADKAKKFAASGLDRVNINIDTMKYLRYREADLNDLIEGINAATDAGLKPVKINVVMKKGYNDREIMDFVQLTLQHEYEIRFIEMNEREEAECEYDRVTNEEIREKLPVLRAALLDADGNPSDDPRDGTADVYKYPGARGKIGFINKRAADFASRCAGLFLGADGVLKRDEEAETGVDLTAVMDDPAKLSEAIGRVLSQA